MQRLFRMAVVLPLALVVANCEGPEQCDPACGDGTTCQDGRCVALAAPSCAPACGPCQVCDVDGAAPVCVDMCASDLTCQDNICVRPVEAACTPACSDCQMCDTSGARPECIDLCASGTHCGSGACVPDAAPACSPACSACQTCDVSGASPVCVDNCGAGTSCVDSACQAVDPCAAAPCGACQMCDTSGASPACVALCGSGTHCAAGACEPDLATTCSPACSACQTCDTDHGAPLCVDSCMAGQYCDATAAVCRPNGDRPSYDHSALAALQGPFTADITGGKAVTAVCLGCHAQAGADVLATAHWKWQGATPGLAGHTSGREVGKKNLVNNFCVAIPSNEKRCTQCHVGYGWVDNSFDFSDPGNIDCLACHSPNYKKDPTSGGGPLDGINDGTTPAVDMVLAAQTVGRPTRATCGGCHFNAGGGDSVKKGDIYSALGNPASPDVDVHMGNAEYDFQCVDCHVSRDHQIIGAGVHLPVSEGRVDCIDCHGRAPHASALQNNHARDVACQTCHIPAFARQKPTKMDWNWSTAGNRDRGTNGIETSVVNSFTVTSYDAMKGDFVWLDNVRPEYAWYNGETTRMTLADSFAAGAGTSTTRIHLGGPTASADDADAVIFPFKVMRGQQPVDVTNRIVSSPKLFGPGGFWAAIPPAGSYDATTVQNNWTSALTAGARYAGQIGATETYVHVSAASGSPRWDWAYTEMWLGINHEVAPATAALGCSDCHFGAAGWDWSALGYTCDPASPPNGQTAATCGSRHP